MTVFEVNMYVGEATEDEIIALIQFCQREVQTRKENAKKKEAWVDKMYRAYLNHPHASDRRTENKTIVALYDRNRGVKIGIAKCSPTDTFNEKVGLAVAYARAIDAYVPSYV